MPSSRAALNAARFSRHLMPELTLEDYILNLQSPNADVRRNAAWTLGRSRDFRIIEPLIAAINDPDDSVRVRVAEALGNLRYERTVAPLMDRLAAEQNDEIRAQIISSLGRQGDFTAFEAILAALKDTSPLIRGAAAEALSAFFDQRAIDALVSALLHDSDENTRFLYAKSLRTLGSEMTTQALTAALTPDLDVERKLQLIELMGQIADKNAAEALCPLLNDEDEAVRETAKWALRQLGVG